MESQTWFRLIILALDPSLNSTGFAVIDTSKRTKAKRVLHYGHIPNHHIPNDEVGLKLTHIEMTLKTLLIVYKPNVIVAEDLTGNQFNDLKQNSKAHGIVEKVCVGRNLVRINNKHFKKEFTGNGNAKKEQVAEKVLEFVPNLHFKTDDESDSVGIGIYYAIKLGEW